MNKEELLEFKKKNITDEVIMNLEASLHLNMKIVADEDKKQEFKEYQMAVYSLRKQRDNLQQELQRKDNIINELKQNKRDYEVENILEMKLHILNNNWNELKEWLDKRSELTNMGIVLDKIKELENDN